MALDVQVLVESICVSCPHENLLLTASGSLYDSTSHQALRYLTPRKQSVRVRRLRGGRFLVDAIARVSRNLNNQTATLHNWI